ncbi:TIGR03086 family metal-binding protein [Nocardia asteroides]|uniref:TIGR03086 family metal-binding protein n=1 Tax=Nocardia asteroides TaxID=1824 RepID=UPI001E43E853|nr:TIGR03086 family metal-binding protein [Nocardia asteroides]UGT64316.1 TIGR03086 family metal-binding protein [Nocardia asteroides]
MNRVQDPAIGRIETETVVAAIDRALDTAGAAVAALEPGSLGAATLCAEWDVHTLLDHLVTVMYGSVAALSDITGDAELPEDVLGSDPQGAFATAAELDRAAWSRPDALERAVPTPLGELPGPSAALAHLLELTVHGTDLALAVGRPDLADDALCAALLEAVLGAGGLDLYRQPGWFDAAVPVADDAPGHLRLLAYTGRRF